MGCLGGEFLLHVHLGPTGEPFPENRVAEQFSQAVAQSFGVGLNEIGGAVVQHLSVSSQPGSQDGRTRIEVRVNLHRGIEALEAGGYENICPPEQIVQCADRPLTQEVYPRPYTQLSRPSAVMRDVLLNAAYNDQVSVGDAQKRMTKALQQQTDSLVMLQVSDIHRDRALPIHAGRQNAFRLMTVPGMGVRDQ